ncbi:MAG TPA: acyltransferase [Chitinivibrionales bacterium]|nr:acyltransferase [Chitinivibrionales bacterium]
MKDCRLLLLNVIAYILSIFTNSKLSKATQYIIDKTYSIYLSRQFFKIGKNSFWEFPAFIHGPDKISIGKNFYAFPRLRIEAFEKHLGAKFSPSIIIGNNVSINYDCHIACINRIEIGNHVVIASRVFITDHYHGEASKQALETPPDQRTLVSKGPVIIEDNVLIGEGVAIMPNVRIGKNAIIGANSVITHDIKANTVVAGVPVKVIKDFS